MIYMSMQSQHKSLFKSLDATINTVYLDRKELDFTADGDVFSHEETWSENKRKYQEVEFKGSCKKVNYQDLMLMVEKEQEEFNSDFVL
jgi:hypothetical protein